MIWSQKYAPKSLREFINQQKALGIFLRWIKNWKPGMKCLLFFGPPGVGKTCLLQAYAREKKLDFIEMNASDYRSGRKIREVLGESTKQKSLFGRGKILAIDEVDGITGKEDKGGIKELIKIIKESNFPIVLIANDPWQPKLRPLRNYCILVEFKKLSVHDIEKRLEQICKNEGIEYEKEAIKEIARMSKGDLRGAINDLETAAKLKKRISIKDLAFSQREVEASIFDALKIIFKTRSILAAKLSINNVDKDPDEIFWWIENNITQEYEHPEELAKAYDALSKADLFRQRVRFRQNWKLKGYMIDLMTGGVAVAKRNTYRKFTKYQFPSKIKILGQTKLQRKEEKEILLKLSKQLHCSTEKVRKEFLPYLKLFKSIS